MESGVPAQISFGFGMGFCCGFAAKKTAKVALVGIGLAFGSLQVRNSCAVGIGCSAMRDCWFSHLWQNIIYTKYQYAIVYHVFPLCCYAAAAASAAAAWLLIARVRDSSIDLCASKKSGESDLVFLDFPDVHFGVHMYHSSCKTCA